MSPLASKSLVACLFSKTINPAFLRKSHVSFSLYFSTSVEKSPAITPSVYEYLISKHRFSHEAASHVASLLTGLRNPYKADSMLSFLRDSGFSKAQVEKVVTYRPALLSADLEHSIKPKFKVFQERGFSGDEIADIISKGPSVLHCSVDKRLIPSFSVLEGLLGSKVEVGKVLKVCGWFLMHDLERTLVPNMEFLKSCAVPVEKMIKLLCVFPRFFLSKPEIMREYVEKVDHMGVERSSGMFIYAVRVVSSMTNETWELKLNTFRSLGFSEDDISRVFRSVPMVFSVSENKIKKITEVLLGTGKYNMSCIVNSPTTLMYSVEKRYKPRLKVLEVLEKRDLIKVWPSVGTLHVISDAKFFMKYVNPFLEELGELAVAWSRARR